MTGRISPYATHSVTGDLLKIQHYIHTIATNSLCLHDRIRNVADNDLKSRKLIRNVTDDDWKSSQAIRKRGVCASGKSAHHLRHSERIPQKFGTKPQPRTSYTASPGPPSHSRNNAAGVAGKVAQTSSLWGS